MGTVARAALAAGGHVTGIIPDFLQAREHMLDDVQETVVVPDMQAYDAFYKRLIAAVPLKNVTSRFAMERVKATTILPIEHGLARRA